uniref:Sodium ion channel toxin n=1 Tax=Edwardsia elegans TaxID=132404 RepID=A0A4Y5RXX4_9CNID|nr:sodium ion channel toxin [Edwardsia elegans]
MYGRTSCDTTSGLEDSPGLERRGIRCKCDGMVGVWWMLKSMCPIRPYGGGYADMCKYVAGVCCVEKN